MCEELSATDTLPVVIGSLVLLLIVFTVASLLLRRRTGNLLVALEAIFSMLFMVTLRLVGEIMDTVTDVIAGIDVLGNPKYVTYHASYVALLVLAGGISAFGFWRRTQQLRTLWGNAADGKNPSTDKLIQQSLLKLDEVKVTLAVLFVEDIPMFVLNVAIILSSKDDLQGTCKVGSEDIIGVSTSILFSTLITACMIGAKLPQLLTLRDLLRERANGSSLSVASPPGIQLAAARNPMINGTPVV